MEEEITDENYKKNPNLLRRHLKEIYNNVNEGYFDETDDDSFCCNLNISELGLEQPTIVFAQIIPSNPPHIRYYAMSKDVLHYYIKNSENYFKDWVINFDSSAFKNIYILSDEGNPLSLTGRTRKEVEGKTIIGGEFLHKASLNIGHGGKHGERIFFQLHFDTGRQLIDSKSLHDMLDVENSTLFLVTPKKITYRTFQPESNIEETRTIPEYVRTGGINSSLTTVSGNHGQSPSTLLNETELFSEKSITKIKMYGVDDNEISKILKLNKLLRIKRDNHEKFSPSLLITQQQLISQAMSNINPPESLLEEISKIEDAITLSMSGIAVDEAIETDNEGSLKEEREYGFSYIFSPENVGDYIPLKTEMSNSINNELLISMDSIPDDEPIISGYNRDRMIVEKLTHANFKIKDDKGELKSVCGKIKYVYSDLSRYRDSIEEPSNGIWIYVLEVKIRESEVKHFLVPEKRALEDINTGDLVYEKVIDKDIEIEPIVFSDIMKEEYTMKLITYEEAKKECPHILQQTVAPFVSITDLTGFRDFNPLMFSWMQRLDLDSTEERLVFTPIRFNDTPQSLPPNRNVISHLRSSTTLLPPQLLSAPPTPSSSYVHAVNRLNRFDRERRLRALDSNLPILRTRVGTPDSAIRIGTNNRSSPETMSSTEEVPPFPLEIGSDSSSTISENSQGAIDLNNMENVSLINPRPVNRQHISDRLREVGDLRSIRMSLDNQLENTLPPRPELSRNISEATIDSDDSLGTINSGSSNRRTRNDMEGQIGSPLMMTFDEDATAYERPRSRMRMEQESKEDISEEER